MKRFFRAIAGVRTEVWIFVLAVACGAASTWYVYSLGLTIGTGDQSARLNLARFAVDSMTPGITQLGFTWRPLVQILFIPFVMSSMLYHTGMAGPLLLVPCFGLSAALLYKITADLAGRACAVAVAVAFILNPYALYFSSVPMTEMLFIMLVLASAWLTMQWIETQAASTLLNAGITISLAFLCRIEGITLIPAVAAVVVVTMLLRKRSISEIGALLFMFGLVSCTSIVAMSLYGYFFKGSWFAFIDGGPQALQTSSVPLVDAAAHPTVDVVARIFYAATEYVVGARLAAFSLALASLLPFMRKKAVGYPAVLLLLCPCVFVFYALLQSKINILIPGLPDLFHPNNGPSAYLLDVRYVLSFAPLLFLAPAIAGSVLVGLFSRVRMKWLGAILAASIVVPVPALTALHLAQMYGDKLAFVKEDIAYAGDPGADVYLPGYYLREHYDFGKILSAQGPIEHRIFIVSELPLKTFIQDSNYRFYDQALREPWLFTRWVIVGRDPEGRIDPFIAAAEKTPSFAYYFELVFDSSGKPLRRGARLYKLNEERLRAVAKKLNVDPLKIPSLNPAMSYWDPQTVYDDLRGLNGRTAPLAPSTP